MRSPTGGQMWRFHYIVCLAQPTLAGFSTVDNTQLYVTRCWIVGPPVRIGAPPDIFVGSLQALPCCDGSNVVGY